MPAATNLWLNKIAKEKTKLLQEFFEMEPIHVDVMDPKTKKNKPHTQGEHIIYQFEKIYSTDPMMKGIVVETVTGPSTPGKDYYDDIKANPAMPYQQIRALVGDGGKWKWPEIWKQIDLLPRRGPAWRHIDDPSNLGQIENPNPDIKPLNCVVIGGGPIGIRMAIELVLGGHRVTLWEKRREIIDEATGKFESVGFTNRVNRPHINNFCRNDLDRLNGRNFMTPKMCYPIFTNGHTSSIGIDESQILLLKTALLLGVNVELGVGYDGAEIDIENEKNQRPSWMVEYSADKIAQERYKKEAKGTQRFDCLFGCDGGQSKVRTTQVEWLGEPKTRKYKKMYGIVSNLRKCSKTKLKDLGFQTGLEPEDLAGGKTGVFFYKASYHNYFIVHPSSEEMAENGIPWKGVFGFHKARGAANKEKDDMKANFQRYMTKKAKELNIPIDETLENNGFVEAPNDVMGFDFSEFYNCEKSAAFMAPPLDWDTDKDGEWEIFCPLVALAGDAVADPNWLLGVGLQRGWNSAFDAVFLADNLYNNKTFNGQPPNAEEPMKGPFEWSEHLDNMTNLMTKLGNAARESKLSPEMDTGLFDEKGPVVVQIRRQLKARNIEAPCPAYLPLVEPWGRYKEFDLTVRKNYKGKLLFSNIHPVATRELAVFERNTRWVDTGTMIKKRVTRPTASMLTWPKRFECSAFWGMMKLLEIDGKAAPGEKVLDKNEADEPPPVESPPPKLDPNEVFKRATRKSMNLRESIVLQAMNPAPKGLGVKDRGGLDALIFQAANKGKARSGGDDDEMSPTHNARKSSDEPVRRTSLLTNDELLAINNLTAQLKGTGMTAKGGTDPALDVLKAKLAYAEREVASVNAQQSALKAKMTYAEKEVEMIQNCLEAYKKESKKKAMMR